MLYQIVSFLLEIAVAFVGGACLLRLHMQALRVPFGNPVGRLVFAVTDWIVLPLRRVVKPLGRWDLSSLLAAYLLVLAKTALLWTLLGAATPAIYLPVIAVFALAQLGVSMLTALFIVYAVLSWVQPYSPLRPIVDRLCGPLLAPLRRHLPEIAGFDFSSLVALVLLQVLAMVLGGLQGEMLRLL
ncbi:YggT family protein [Xylophilus sp. ASV27]|uniref:YggT family protein n=1 Tax=Xylophilus sp. ASV27 TaxID=2795129 RepID=UPI0018EA68DE|nr:YggT family protein [Xylophilus sp. ASV27]